MICVNRANKEFKDLAAMNDISINTMELITHKYWKQTGKEDQFPPSLYIQTQLGQYQYKEPIQEVRTIYNREYKQPHVYDTLEELDAARKEALKYFPREAASFYINSQGKYVLNIKEPVQEFDDIPMKKEVLSDEQASYHLSFWERRYKLKNKLNLKLKNTKSLTLPLARKIVKEFNQMHDINFGLTRDFVLVDNFPETLADAVDATGAEATNGELRTIAAFMQKLFPGIKVKTVKDKAAFNTFLDENRLNSNAEAVVIGDTIYTYAGLNSADILLEEFLHPFIEILYNDKPTFFNAMLEEAKNSFSLLKRQIDESYASTKYKPIPQSTRDKELVTQALSRYFRESLGKDKSHHNGFKYFLNKFIRFIKDIFGYENPPEIKKSRLGTRIISLDSLTNITSLEKLADALNTEGISINVKRGLNKTATYHLTPNFDATKYEVEKLDEHRTAIYRKPADTDIIDVMCYDNPNTLDMSTHVKYEFSKEQWYIYKSEIDKLDNAFSVQDKEKFWDQFLSNYGYLSEEDYNYLYDVFNDTTVNIQETEAQYKEDRKVAEYDDREGELFPELVLLKKTTNNEQNINNLKQEEQQNPEYKWDRYAPSGKESYEVSSKGDKRFSALYATFKQGTVIDGIDVSGKTIEWVYQNIIKKSGKGKAPANNSILNSNEWTKFFYEDGDTPLDTLPSDLYRKMDIFTHTGDDEDITKQDLEDISYYMGYFPLWQEWAKQNPELIKELREQAKGKYLTDQFANTRVSQARALADILNSSNPIREQEEQKENTQVNKNLDEYDLLNQQINNLLDSEIISASEVRHIAELIVYAISDIITSYQRNPSLATQDFNLLNTQLDFSKASRKDIIEAVGLSNLITRVKTLFSDSATQDIDTMMQAQLILDNWDALLTIASDVFVANEGFGIIKDVDTGTFSTTEATVQDIDVDNFNESQDADTVAETKGDVQEHWQVESRTIDVLTSMSDIVRRAINECYILDVDGNKVMSKWGIAERVNPREAVNGILRWTKGNLSLKEMITSLQAKESNHPWVSQLIERLTKEDGTESTFQSQFFGVFCKDFQKYCTVILDDKQYTSIVVNEHPALTEIIQSISAQIKTKEHPLFTSKGINKKLLGKKDEKITEFTLHQGLYNLQQLVQEFKHGTTLDEENLKVATENILGVSHILGFNCTEDMVSNALNEDTITSMTSLLSIIVKTLDKQVQKENQNTKEENNYDPLAFNGENNISSSLRNFLAPITEQLEDTAVNAFYDSGKMYQSYVIPSFLTQLFDKFNLQGKDFENFIKENYANSEWYKFNSYQLDRGWRTPWLKQLVRDTKSREIFDHKVELNFNKHNYMRRPLKNILYLLLQSIFQSLIQVKIHQFLHGSVFQ